MSTNTFTEAQRQRIKSNMDGTINTMREAVAMSERRLHSAKRDGITGADIGREAYALAQGLANSLSSISNAMEAREMELQARVLELEKALSGCLAYLNEIIIGNRIPGDHPVQVEMRQRAKAQQQVAIDALGVRSLFGPVPNAEESTQKARDAQQQPANSFGPYTDDDDTSHLMGG